jgi:Phosphotransferase enzyme family
MRSHARGLVVLVAGPDGAGKSSVALRIVDELAGEVTPIVHTHWRPGLLPHPRALLGGRGIGDSARPHARTPHGTLVSLGLLGYYWLDFFLGGWLRHRAIRRRGGLVVVERGWWDVGIDSRRYRLRASPAVVRALGVLLPHPDLALVLHGDPHAVALRKGELVTAEVARQNALWRKTPVGRRKVVLDAAEPEDAVLGRAVAAVRTTLARPGPRWATLPSAPLGRADPPAFDGDGSGPEPRWWLPRDSRRVLRDGLLLYHPVTAKGLAVRQAAWFLAGAGLGRLLPGCEEPPAELGRAIETRVRDALEQAGLEPPSDLVFAAARCARRGRFVAVCFDREGSPTAIAKIALRDDGRVSLAHEAANLARLRHLPAPLEAPTILARGDGVLLFAVERWCPRRLPLRMPTEVAKGLGELFVSRGDSSVGPAHGDAVPWNLLRTRTGWLLVDWENATEAPPFHDVFHYLVHSFATLGRPRGEEILDGLAGKGWVGAVIRAYAEGAGVAPEAAPPLLARYLESNIDPGRRVPDGQVEIHGPNLAAGRRLLAEVRR